MIRRQTGGGLKQVSRAWRMTATGVKRVIRVRRYDGTTANIVATFSTPVTLAASPASVSGLAFAADFGSSPVTTAATTLTPTGGTAPYTYAYAITTEPSYGLVTIDSPSAATTTFTHNGVGAGEVLTATATATVTDALAQTATTTIALTFRCISTA